MQKFSYEVLRARIAIRDLFLRNIVKNIYKNIRQKLSLLKGHQSLQHGTTNSQELVGNVIRDLRILSRSFYPDKQLENSEQWKQGLKEVIKSIFPRSNLRLQRSDIWITGETFLVVVNMILELLISIEPLQGKTKEISLSFIDVEVEIKIIYIGKMLQVKKWNSRPQQLLSFKERLKLLKASFHIITLTLFRIQLVLTLHKEAFCHESRY